jgi:aconitate hydratase
MQLSSEHTFQRSTLQVRQGIYQYFPLEQLSQLYCIDLEQMPYCLRILLESAIRNFDGESIPIENVESLARWSPKDSDHGKISFMPSRILLQDLTGVPLVVDLACLRSAAAKAGKDPSKINPLLPVDLVIDHSIQVDYFGSSQAYSLNTEVEYQRNLERYQFLKWAQSSIKNFKVIPPASGIVHQVNLEYLAQVAMVSEKDGEKWVYPDSVFGTDSHTTMVNGLGVLGWGVGGIEAAAAMLGQPVETLIPDVIGVNVTGQLHEGSSPTDIVLTLTQMLRELGVVNKMVEFYGPGLDTLTVPDRAMLANMAPEYGATAAYFPVDEAVLVYLRLTGRSDEQIGLVEAYYQTQGLFRRENGLVPIYTKTIELDLGGVEPALAGPKRPQDLVPLSKMSINYQNALTKPVEKGGYGVAKEDLIRESSLVMDGEDMSLSHGAVVIAAITSCTNTSNPFALISAGLLAKKAVALGLSTKPHVKTSLAPGSKAVMVYLEKAGLVKPLEQLGFYLAGYGCTTCIGNSGPLPPEVSKAIANGHLNVASVTSGNRNFEGRIHPLVQANYLASPALVVAYALAGSVQIDMIRSPIGYSAGKPIHLKDIWPTNLEVQNVISQVISPEIYINTYAHITDGDAQWQSIETISDVLYPWNPVSTYILEHPFCEKLKEAFPDIDNARILAILGDSITTDHISPAGSIAGNSPAAEYLKKHNIAPSDFNTYGSRRGNHEIMVRGTFANIRIKNQMLPGVEGGFATHYPDLERLTIYEAAMLYQREGVDLVVLAGKEYGTGSSRDWAAKGPLLLGVKAIIAESFERIHRSNLVGMGILPLQFMDGQNTKSLGISGEELISLPDISQISPRKTIEVTAKKTDGNSIAFHVTALLNSEKEVQLWKSGGILRSFRLE